MNVYVQKASESGTVVSDPLELSMSQLLLCVLETELGFSARAGSYPHC